MVKSKMWLTTTAVSLAILSRMGQSGCTDYTSERTCSLAATCYWEDYDDEDNENDACICNSTVDQAISFVMDGSTSVSQSGWDTEKQFVIDMIETGITQNSKVSVVRFSNGNNKNKVEWEFTEDQNRQSIINHIDAISFPRGGTQTTEGLKKSAGTYEDANGQLEDMNRLLMLITDGTPNPLHDYNPCWQSEDDVVCWRCNNGCGPVSCNKANAYANAVETREELADQNISIVIIGITQNNNWDPEILECLVEDPDTGIILVDEFDEEELNAIRGQTDAFLCPETIRITLTELRVNESKPTGFSGDQSFVEVYNRGDPWDFSSQNLILEGFLTCNITTGSWAFGQYLVIYDGSRDLPDCEFCECTEDSENPGWCNDAIYINASTIEKCVFDYTMSNTKWRQYGADLNNWLINSNYFDVSYDEETGDGFEDGSVTVPDGYTFTLKRFFRSQYARTNWQASCTEFGTPGDGPILNCSQTCIDGMCNINGDTGGQCSSNDKYCICTAEDHFYPEGNRCLYLDPPEDCVVEIFKDVGGDGSQTEYATWRAAPVDKDHEYEFRFYVDEEEQSGFTPSLFYTYSEEEPYESPLPEVRTRLFTRNKWYYSVWEECRFISQAPTIAPTKSPTHSTPPVECDVQVQAGTTKNFDITWDQVDLSGPITPSNESSFYRIYFYYENEFQSSEDITRETGGISEYSYTWETLDQDITNPLEQVNFTIMYEVIEDDGYTWSNEELEDRAFTCEMVSFAPTKNPTAFPTREPTKNPTKNPTAEPTSTPTVEAVAIVDCDIFVIPKDNEDDLQQVNITWTLDVGGRDIDVRILMDYADNVEIDLATEEDDGSKGVTRQINDPYSVNYFLVYPAYKEYPTADEKPFTNQGSNCTLTSVAPTANPTKYPTTSPTPNPSEFPTTNPTKFPSTAPTMTPTYQTIAITNCSYLLRQFRNADDADAGLVRDFVLTFYEPQYRDGDFESDMSRPLLSEVEYAIEWPGGGSTGVAAESNAKWEFEYEDEEINVDDTLTVQVAYKDEGRLPLNPEIVCDPITLAPTSAPTNPLTTPSPTFENPVIYWEPNKEDASRCEPTSGLIDDTEIYEYPICDVVEQSETHEFHVSVAPQDFGPNILVNWRISFEDPLIEGRMPQSVEDDDENSRMASEADFFELEGETLIIGCMEAPDTCDGAKAEIGVFKESDSRRRRMMLIADDALQGLKRRLLQDDEEEIVDFDNEYAYLELVNCTVTNNVGTEYTCSVSDGTDEEQPPVILLNIPNEEALVGNGGRDPVPWWIWIIVAGAAIIVLLGALLGYRIWNKRKFAEEALAEQEAELARLEAETAEGQTDTGLTVNPIATGGAMTIAGTGDIMDQRRARELAQMDWADVDTEAINFQDTMGQVMPAKPEGDPTTTM